MKKDRKPGRKRAGTNILLQIIVLVVIVFIASGVVSFLFFRNSQANLIQDSKDKLVEYRANMMCSSNKYVLNLMIQIQFLSFPGFTPQELIMNIGAGVVQQTVSPEQTVVNNMLKMLVDNGFWNSKLALFAIPPYEGYATGPLVIMSSDDKMMYENVPEVLVNLVNMNEGENTTYRKRYDDRNSYMYFPEGIPELGLKGEYLVTAYRYSYEDIEGELWYFDFGSMHDQIAAIDSFYRTESRSINIALLLVMAGGVIALIVITFIALRYFIRKKITKPIDELEAVAGKIMEGDLDVQVPVREGEEFYGLKTAFNNMIMSLRVLINKSMGIEDETIQPSGGVASDENGKPGRKKRGRSSILLPVTAVVVIIFIIAGAASLLLYQRSMTQLVDKSKQRIVKSEAEGVSSGHDYLAGLLGTYFTIAMPELLTADSLRGVMEAVQNREVGSVQTIMNDAMKYLVDEGFDGIDLIFYATPGIPGIADMPMVFVCSDASDLFKELPDELVDLMEMTEEENGAYRARLNDANSYMLTDNGIPELGIEGKHLVVAYNQGTGETGVMTFWLFDFKPMGEQLSEINDFYNKQSRTAIILMIIVTLISIIAVSAVTLLVLNYLIKSRITRPVDELERIAAEVMEGNLDVEIPISRGEEFERLKRAFNEMLKSLNDLI